MTPRQAQAFRFIDATIRQHDASPSYDQIAYAIGMIARSNVFRIVKALIEQGYLRRDGRKKGARNLVVIKRPPWETKPSAIEAAIMSERDRCAEIAMTYNSREAIVAAIRCGEHVKAD